MSEVGEFKFCPFCKEKIRTGAVKCRFCGEWLDEGLRLGHQVEAMSDGRAVPAAIPPQLITSVSEDREPVDQAATPAHAGRTYTAESVSEMKGRQSEHHSGIPAPMSPPPPESKSGIGAVLVNGVLSEGPKASPKTEQTGRFRFTKDLSKLTTLAKRMIWIEIACIALLFVCFIVGAVRAFLSTSSGEGATGMEIFAYSSIAAWMIATISAETTFLVWVFRANLNCHGFGALGMQFSPGWSVGWYFIPFLNLYYPYQAIKEIWKISKNPQNWQGERCSRLIGWWWALRIMSFVCAGPLGIVVVGIPACILQQRLVSEVFALQQRLTVEPRATGADSLSVI